MGKTLGKKCTKNSNSLFLPNKIWLLGLANHKQNGHHTMTDPRLQEKVPLLFEI